ncbi:hypothetical protein KL929_003970 [Ogataea haglerorum]|nr:hypothetical protein KL929_003970 [Ogataea haglerorum]
MFSCSGRVFRGCLVRSAGTRLASTVHNQYAKPLLGKEAALWVNADGIDFVPPVVSPPSVAGGWLFDLKSKTNESDPKDESRKKDKKDDDKNKPDTKTPRPSKSRSLAPSAGSGVAAGANGSSGSAGAPGDSGSGDDPADEDSSVNSPATVELPEIYPPIIGLPISRRPLFPGFYRSVIITDVNVIKAVKEATSTQYPFIGCFLFKDENMEGDVINSKDEVYSTGVLAQITSNVYTRDTETGVETLTTVLFPHKRIKIDELFVPNVSKTKHSFVKVSTAEVDESADKQIIEGITGEKEGDEPKSPSEVIKSSDEDVVIDEDDEYNPTAFLKKYPISLVNVSNVEDEPYPDRDPRVNSLTAITLETLREITKLNKPFSDQLLYFISSLKGDVYHHPERLADYAAAVAAATPQELQDVMDCTNIPDRLDKALNLLRKELMNKELQKQIERDLEERMAKRHREFNLQEQLKWIKKELGIDDGRDKLIAKYNDRASKLKFPEEVQKVFQEEINKLQTLEPLMAEYAVTRNYLDWLTQLPWGLQSKDRYDLKIAKQILDEDHYGLKEVKDRILEFIAVGKLLNKINGKIICFVGPPGVGKTSIGKSIARALNRKFYRFSVGGLTDVAEIKGHRRTYVGAIPGRMVQALKNTETENPLVLIDEIDKISHTHHGSGGDPSAALLELLDPEQNGTFMDYYMDVPINLSRVLFVCTANTLSTIPAPLLDRMEVIEIAGYVEDEKIKIAENYLAPSAKETSGLTDVDIALREDTLQQLIRGYCRESGVRNLKKQIEKIFRKAALKVVKDVDGVDFDKNEKVEQNEQAKEAAEATESESTTAEASETSNSEKKEAQEEVKDEAKEEAKEEEEAPKVVVPEGYKIEVTPDNLKDYVGSPVYTADRLYEKTPPGVVMGLAWTQTGGSALYIESIIEHAINKDSTPKLERTGQLGDVMKESVRIAYSFSKMYLAKKFAENRFFDRAQIHLHCPEGATPKDGPSAGVAITSSFLSLALNKPLRPDVAMTGELTLTGRVLRIGGLKEKTLAARRSGVNTVIFPKDNLADWHELQDNVKEGITPVPVEWYDEVFATLFGDVTADEGNAVWKKEFELIDQAEKDKK